MDENIVIQRGKKAGNVLLIQTCVIVVLYILTIVGDSNSSDIQSDLIVAAILGIIGILFSFILIKPLRRDDLKEIRGIYIFLGVISVLGLYSSVQDNTLLAGIIGVLPYALVIIALYHLGKDGKICCFFAAGISLISAFLPATNPEFDFATFVASVLSCVYYIFLGLYIESKGMQIEENPTSEGTDPHIYYCNTCGSVYSGYNQKERLCPDCATELIETSITVDEWHKLGDPQKNTLKQAFANGERLESSVSKNTNNDEQSDRSMSKYDELYKLKELMENGVITPAEYEAKKKQILEL